MKSKLTGFFSVSMSAVYGTRWIIILTLILLGIIFIMGIDIYHKEMTIHFDETISSDAQFIDSTESERFMYNTQVILNGIKVDNGLKSVQFRIQIEPKNHEIYQEVEATAFLDPAIKSALVTQSFLTFGSDFSLKPTIGTPDSKGIIMQRSTWTQPDKSEEILISELKRPIKVKVKWNGGGRILHN